MFLANTTWEYIAILHNPYSITFVLSSFVALIGVWFSLILSRIVRYKQMRKNLLIEIRDSIERCDHLPKLIDNDFEQSENGVDSLFGLPLFYNDVWTSLKIRGQ
jgi:hypothetical protein